MIANDVLKFEFEAVKASPRPIREVSATYPRGIREVSATYPRGIRDMRTAGLRNFQALKEEEKNPSLSHPGICSVSRSVGQSVGGLVGRSVSRSVGQLVGRSVAWLIRFKKF